MTAAIAPASTDSTYSTGSTAEPQRAARNRTLRSAPSVRPAPRREPPFDDELDHETIGRHDRRLPFEASSLTDGSGQQPLRGALPAPSGWARRLLVGLSEAASGRRQLAQLSSVLSPSVAWGLAATFESAATLRSPHWIADATVRRVRAFEPASGVGEVCACVEARGRVHAVALRLEERDGRWRCTRLQLG